MPLLDCALAPLAPRRAHVDRGSVVLGDGRERRLDAVRVRRDDCRHAVGALAAIHKTRRELHEALRAVEPR